MLDSDSAVHTWSNSDQLGWPTTVSTEYPRYGPLDRPAPLEVVLWVHDAQQGIQAKLSTAGTTQLIDGRQDLPSNGVALVADPLGDGEVSNRQ